MTTVSRGQSFERLVFKELKSALRSRRLGLLPESSSVHRGKGYYSHDRGANIIIDVSIEVTLPGAASWSILWVWECKDYSSAVPVSDVEEFYAKLQQIAGANVKGGFASRGPLQSGAIAFAKAKGIAVVRIRRSREVEFVQFEVSGGHNPYRYDHDQCEYEMLSPSPRTHLGAFHGLTGQLKVCRSFKSMVEQEVFSWIRSLPPPTEGSLDEDVAVDAIASWLNERPWSLNREPILYSFVEKLLGLEGGVARDLIPLAASRLGLQVRSTTDEVVVLCRKKPNSSQP